MRLGEIKNIIERSLNENNQIFIDYDTLYGGQAYMINNFREIMDALDILINEEWNPNESGTLEEIKNKHRLAATAQLDAAEFNYLNSYISALNSNIVLYYSILEKMTTDQDEKTVNIKIPESKIKSLRDLTNLNNRLEKVLKKFNIDGEFEFKGFDNGTNWYIVVPVGVLSYQFIIACLKIAQEFFKTKKEYYNSKNAELDYRASLEKDSNYSKNGLEKYKDKRLELFIEDKIREAIEVIDKKNGHTEAELSTKLISATKDLIKELDDGVEFHLSLNPPEYAREQAGQLVIDYKKIKAIRDLENKKTPQIKAPLEENKIKE